ncbi:MAG: hypothetical protein JST39_21685 [Bacteroidetes bacterium]|nr:hypothetical protein [Bacteroidota bacterium]
MVLLPLLLSTGCKKDVKALEIQQPYTYDDQYNANLRAYKQTDHTLCFGWYAAYAPIAGATGYKNPASWGERIMGLPDSMDIVSLWMGIPGNDSTKPGYAPIAYADWKYVSKVKGTKFLCPTIVNFNGKVTLKNGTVFDCTLPANRTDSGIKVYGQYLVDQMLDSDIDGLDIDWEPGGGEWLNSPNTNFVKLIQYIGQFCGPMSGKNKILSIDFYSTAPPAATGQYANYFIRQAYSQGTGGVQNATNLQNYYNSVSAGVPPGKFIVTENFGDFSENGGTPFTEANGNTLTTDGSIMYSLEGMARWNPTQGRKAGFGAFYFDRDYYSKTGVPYYNVRRAIQIANPSAK